MKCKEQILVEKIAGGDRVAQQELYTLYAGRLLAISTRYVGRRDVAEDNLHDAFVKIFRSFASFNYRGEGSLRAWMDRITINCALEWLRRERRFDFVSNEEETLSLQAVEEPNVEEVSMVSQELLLRFVSELPDGYRTIFNLFCVEGYSHREIADELGINERSSSSQLLRAKRALGCKIKDYLDSNG